MLGLSLFHIVPKAVHLEDFVSLQNQVMLFLKQKNDEQPACFFLPDLNRSIGALAGFKSCVDMPPTV